MAGCAIDIKLEKHLTIHHDPILWIQRLKPGMKSAKLDLLTGSYLKEQI
jgi:hypothetical protein